MQVIQIYYGISKLRKGTYVHLELGIKVDYALIKKAYLLGKLYIEMLDIV